MAAQAWRQSIGQQLSKCVAHIHETGKIPLRALLGLAGPGQQLVWCRQDLQVGAGRSIVTGHTHIPRKKHDRYSTRPTNYVQLLQHITRSRDVSSLSRLVQQYGKKFDAVHVAAAVAMLPKLYQPPAPGGHLNSKQLMERKNAAAKLISQLQVTAASLVPRMFAGQVSSITYALARCSSLLPGGTAANSSTQALLHTMLTRVTADQARLLWQGANGAAITNLLHGIARLGFTAKNSGSSAAAAADHATQQLCRIIARDSDRLHVRQLATAAWALGRMSSRQPGLAAAPSTTAALVAISAAAVSRKLYLRPASMTGLLTAAAWLGRRDEALLAAVAEEAMHQLGDLRPPHLAAFVWAFSTLRFTPPPELTGGLVSEARRQLHHFTPAHLGRFLHGLGELQAHDKQLLADIAAGIAAEEQVSLAPQDAVRLLAPFVLVPDAGSVRDVEGMAQRIASAVRRPARNAAPAVIKDLLVIYSKLPSHHPMLLTLIDAVRERGREFTLHNWVLVLQSAARLGYARVVADLEVEARLVRFYTAAEGRLQQHLQQVLLQALTGGPPSSSSQAQQQQQQQRGSPWSWLKNSTLSSRAPQQQEPHGEQQQQQQQGEPHAPLEVSAVVEMAQLLAQRGVLRPSVADDLAAAAVQLLPKLKLRQVMQLLTALTSRDMMLGQEPVRQFVLAAAERMQGLDLSSTPTATTTVLVGLLQPLSEAISRNLALSSAEPVMQAVYTELLPVLEECSQQQLQSVWRAMKLSGLEDGALASRAKSVAQRNGWLLHSGSLNV